MGHNKKNFAVHSNKNHQSIAILDLRQFSHTALNVRNHQSSSEMSKTKWFVVSLLNM
jgi:hypothetical protein